MSTNTYEQLGNRIAVQGALVAMFTATDERDWDAVAAAFADRVALDYTSLSGARYHAELHRADGRWLITALTMTAIWGQGNQAILGQASPERA